MHEKYRLSRPHSTEAHRCLRQNRAICRAVDSTDQAMAFVTGLSTVKRWPGAESRSSPMHFARPCTDSRSPRCTARPQFPSRSWGRATASSLDRLVEVSTPEWPRVVDLETVGPKSSMCQWDQEASCAPLWVGWAVGLLSEIAPSDSASAGRSLAPVSLPLRPDTSFGRPFRRDFAPRTLNPVRLIQCEVSARVW